MSPPLDSETERNTRAALMERLAAAERALQRHGYRESCDIPACNCGDQWNHGGHASTRLHEIGEELGMLTQGKTILEAIKALLSVLKAAEAGAAVLRAALEKALNDLDRDPYGSVATAVAAGVRLDIRAALATPAGASALSVVRAAEAWRDDPGYATAIAASNDLIAAVDELHRLRGGA